MFDTVLLRRTVAVDHGGHLDVGEGAGERSSTSASGTIRGPKEKNPGKFLERVRNRGLRCRMSSAVWSSTGTTPARYGQRILRLDIAALPADHEAISASVVVRWLCSGIGMFSPGPMIVWSPLINEAGSSGTASVRSAACST